MRQRAHAIKSNKNKTIVCNELSYAIKLKRRDRIEFAIEMLRIYWIEAKPTMTFSFASV